MAIPLETPIVPGPNPRLSKDHLRQTGSGVVLVGQCCDECGRALFPRTGVCPACRSENLADSEMPAQGVLYSWSVVHVAPKPWVTPYVIGYVDLPNGVRVFSHIGGDPARLTVNMEVKLEAAPRSTDSNAGAAPLFLFSPMGKENA
jgi:uncharacterized OB-fold protein